MSRTGFSLLIVLSVAAQSLASRVQIRSMPPPRGELEQPTGPHKCTITWRYRNQEAKMTFGVKGCRTACLGTGSAQFNDIFPLAFDYQGRGNKCMCQDKQVGKDLFKFIGNCGDETPALRKCWEDYKKLSTDTLEEQAGGVETLKLTHHMEEYAFNKFEYECEDNGCADGDCFSSQLPSSIIAGRTEDEKRQLNKLLNQAAMGKNIGDAQVLVDALSEEDKSSIHYAAIPDDYIDTLPEGEAPAKGTRTVRMVKQIYEEKLDGTGVSLDHLLRVWGNAAGFDPDTEEGLDKEVTEEEFQMFLKPECP